jgi:hypothetical protein
MESPPLKPYLSKEDQDNLTLVEAAAESHSTEAAESHRTEASDERKARPLSAVGVLDGERQNEETETFRQTEPSVPTEQTYPNQNQRKGKLRHRLIVSSCLVLSATFFFLSMLNLANVFQQDAKIDSKFQVHPVKPRPELSSELTYKSSAEPKDALIPVVETGWTSKSEGFVDKAGKLVIKPKFAEVSEFSDDLSLVKPMKKDAKWRYINRSGNYAFKGEFENARNFSNGLAAVWNNSSGIGGFINTKGDYVFSTKMRSTPNKLGENLYSYEDSSGRTIYIDSHFKRLFDDEYTIENVSTSGNEKYSTKYFKLHHKGKCGIIDATGKIILQPNYESIISFDNGVATIYVGGNYGFVNENGKTIIDPKYEETTGYADIIGVRQKGKPWHFIDKTGNELNVPPVDGVIKSSEGIWFADGRGAVYNNGKFYWVNEKGLPAFDIHADFITAFKNGFATYWNGEYWRYIDRNGRLASNRNFPTAGAFENGEANVTLAGPMFFLIQSKTIDDEKSKMIYWKEQNATELGRIFPKE